MNRDELGCLAAFLVFVCVILAVWQLVEMIRRKSRHDLLERMLRYTQGNLEKAEADIKGLKQELARMKELGWPASGTAEEKPEPAKSIQAAAFKPAPSIVPPPSIVPTPSILPAPSIVHVPSPLPVPPLSVPLAPPPAAVAPPLETAILPTALSEPLKVSSEPDVQEPLQAVIPTSPVPDSTRLEPPSPSAVSASAALRSSAMIPFPQMAEPSAPSKPFDWESLIGVKLFSWIAGIALFISAILFVIYGVEHKWITPAVQMSLVLALGLASLVGSETKWARQYKITAHAMGAAGIAILFVAFFAGASGWKLISNPVAFLFMALVAAVAVLLSIRRDSIFIALLGLLGGFATPVLLSTHVDHAVGLFSYLLLLNLGLNVVAYRKNWPILKGLSLAFTVLYQFGWVLKFLNESKLGLSLGIFLVFPLLTFGSLLLAKRREEDTPALFERMSSFAAIPPLFFALHLAAVPAYGQNFALLFGFLLILAVGLAFVALFHGPEWLHLLGALSTLLVWAVWFSSSYTHTHAAWPSVLVFLGLFLAVYLGLPWIQSRMKVKRPFTEGGQFAVYAAPMLLFAFPVLVALEPAVRSPGLLFSVLAVFMAALAVYAIRFEEGLVHFTACFFVLLAEAMWSAKYLAPGRLIPALMIYGGFGLFYLGVPILAQSKGRMLKPQGSGSILAFASLVLLFFLAAGPMAQSSLWALALLVGILNMGLLYEASCGHRPILSFLGMLLSWILLAVWWISAPLVGLLIPALVVMGGFAMLVVVGSLWLRTRNPEAEGSTTNSGLFLGLVGHLFLFAVVTQPGLSVPPWPWLGILVVLNLALGVGAFYTKQSAVHVGASVMTQFLFIVWAIAARPANSWPVSARVAGSWAPLVPLCALAFAGLAFAWFELAKRKLPDLKGFPFAAGISLALGLLVLSVLNVVTLTHTPEWHSFFLALFLLGLLALAWRSGRHGWALVGSVLIWLPVLTALVYLSNNYFPIPWKPVLILSTPAYVMLLAYPLVLGERGEKMRLPFSASIVGSTAFFFFARPALAGLGYGSVIGALPVMQALALVPHLMLLLRLEPEGRRDLGRLAAVSGAILAFITLAIPLQLEKEWITLGWALLGAALAWLYTRVPHKGLLVWCGALMVVVLVRLTFNPAMWDYHPRGTVPLLNWYLYTYLIAAGCCFLAVRILGETEDRMAEKLPRLSTVLAIFGAVLIFWLVNIEIADLFSEGAVLTFNFSGGGLAQQLAYTFGWALYAIGLLVVGLVKRNRATRVASIIILTFTIAKAFLMDLSHLTGLYRVASFAGLAICLGAVAVMLQKFVLKKGEEA